MLGIPIYASSAIWRLKQLNTCFSVYFWNDAFCWIHQRRPVRLILAGEIVKLGLFFKDKKVSYVINNLLLLLRFDIHKCTCFKSPPRLVVFKEESVIYLETLREMKSQSKICVYFIRGFWFHNVKTSYSPNISFFFVFIYFSFYRMFYFILYLIW